MLAQLIENAGDLYDCLALLVGSVWRGSLLGSVPLTFGRFRAHSGGVAQNAISEVEQSVNLFLVVLNLPKR